MPRNDNMTRPTRVAPEAFLKTVEPEARRAEGAALLALFGRATGLRPAMWGPSMVGYGRYRYVTGAKRQGEYFLTGFSPRKAALSLYFMPGFERFEAELARLGPHKLGKGCLYLKRLSDADPSVLEDMIRRSVALMREKYESWDN